MDRINRIFQDLQERTSVGRHSGILLILRNPVNPVQFFSVGSGGRGRNYDQGHDHDNENDNDNDNDRDNANR
jgi:hypothetical protein